MIVTPHLVKPVGVGASASADDRVTLVTALGVTPIAFYDARYGVTLVGSDVDQWADTLYSGPTLTAAAAANRPAWDGTTINFDGTDDALASAAGSVFNLNLVPDITVLLVSVIDAPTNGRHIINIMNGASDRYLRINKPASGAIQYSFRDSVTNSGVDSGVVCGSTMRAVIFGNRTTSREISIRVRDAVAVTSVPAGVYASENYTLFLGAGSAIGGTPASPKYRACIVLPTYLDPTSAAATAFAAWAVSYHSAVLA